MKCEPVIPVDWLPHPSAGLYRQLVFSFRKGLVTGGVLPMLTCERTGVVVDRAVLDAYRNVAHDSSESSCVPLLFPHAVLGPVHLRILSHHDFPLRSLGLLHLRNHIVRLRPISVDQPWDVRCQLARQRYVEKGLEFDIDTEVSIAGELVWQSVSTILKRGKFKGPAEMSSLADLFPPLVPSDLDDAHFDIPSNIGKRYAAVSGDYNPIHVSHLAAKLFGFRRAIAHGMWSIARGVSLLSPIDDPIRLDVAFKGPMYVTSRAELKLGQQGRFDLFCGRNPRPVICGLYRTADAKVNLSEEAAACS